MKFNLHAKKIITRIMRNIRKTSVNCAIILLFIILYTNSHAQEPREKLNIVHNSYKTTQDEEKCNIIAKELEKKHPATSLLEPNLEFFDIKEKVLNIKELRGKFVMLYFFASWCVQCSSDLQEISLLERKLKFASIDDIEFYLVSEDFKSFADVELRMQSLKIGELKLLFDPKKIAMSKLGIKSLPTIVLINKEGYVLSVLQESPKWQSKEFMDYLLSIRSCKLDSEKNVYHQSNDSDIMYRKETGLDPITVIN